PKATLTLQHDWKEVFIGETVTLKCEILEYGHREWTYNWYKNGVHSAYGTSQYTFKVEENARFSCKGTRMTQEYQLSTEFSNTVTLNVMAKPKPTVKVKPQTSVYTGDTVTLSCEVQQSTGWMFLWYIYPQQPKSWITVRKNNIMDVTVSEEATSEYGCGARRGQYYTHYSDVVKITAADGSLFWNQTTGQIIIHTISKSDEGLYHCEYPERKESPKSWVSVRSTRSLSAPTGHLKNTSQTTGQRQSWTGPGSSLSGTSLLQAGGDLIYANVGNRITGPTDGTFSKKELKNLKLHSKDAGAGFSDVTYAQIKMKPKKKPKQTEKTREGTDVMYSELKQKSEKDGPGPSDVTYAETEMKTMKKPK
ncbi:uncharacterized protein LOC113568913, partial [Electrophorus electricus]|uniref:uncharacterized protein LOC113568913 n=1 Tax=Electrophorus electricus TaxID=8005 RepID=UPI0015D01451